MKLNKKRYIFIGAILLASVVLFAFLVGGRKKEYDKEDYNVDQIELFSQNKYVLVTSRNDGSFNYGQNYITDFKYNILTEEDGLTSSKVSKEEYFKIKIYNLQDPSKITSKEVNVYDLLGRENTYRLKQIRAQFTRNGKEFLTFSMHSYEKGKPEKIKYFILALESGKIEKEMSEKEINLLLDQKDTRTYMRGTIYKSMDLVRGGIGDQINNALLKNGMEYVPGYIIPSYKIGDSVEVSGTNFAKIYPEIAKKMRDMNKIYFRPDQYNEEEWFNDLIHWFAPEGQDVMELYATDETTGEKTQIRSFNDFKQWVESHPQKEE